MARWARPVLVATFGELSPTDPGYSDARDEVIMSAFSRHREGRDWWLADVGLDLRGAARLGYTSRRPYFDPAGTPPPTRLGYAADRLPPAHVRRRRTRGGARQW